MKSRFSIYASVLVLALSFWVVPALAHHGWAGNLDEEFQISGTVESPVSLAGPHATMKIRADGHVWDLTLAPPARTADAGLKEGIIDRKSTRLNSSHGYISYAVFCLKK